MERTIDGARDSRHPSDQDCDRDRWRHPNSERRVSAAAAAVAVRWCLEGWVSEVRERNPPPASFVGRSARARVLSEVKIYG